MKRQLENRTLCMAAVVIAAIFLLSFLCSCGSRKTITETVIETVHDTIRTVKTDTIKEAKVTIKTDTVKQVEKHVITLNNVGDTIKEVHHYHDIMRTLVVDSTQRYQSKVDSLQSLVEKLKNTEKIVKKGIQVPWWAWVVCPLIFIIGIFYIARWVTNRKWHIT